MIILAVVGALALAGAVGLVLLAKRAKTVIAEVGRELEEMTPNARGPLLSEAEIDRRAKLRGREIAKRWVRQSVLATGAEPIEAELGKQMEAAFVTAKSQFMAAELAKKIGRRHGMNEDQMQDGFGAYWDGGDEPVPPLEAMIERAMIDWLARKQAADRAERRVK